jgi:phosphotransferase system HPr (HPr) family protein
MSEQRLTRTVVVTNPQGLHARPADMFVKTALRFKSKIEVVKDSERVDGKSILSMLTLAAMEGTKLSLEATGGDAQQALEALAELFVKNFANDQEMAEEALPRE